MNSYRCYDQNISSMGIPCKHHTGSNHCSSLTVCHCNLWSCCNILFPSCTHICVSSGILLKWNNLIDNRSVDFNSFNIRLACSLTQWLFYLFLLHFHSHFHSEPRSMLIFSNPCQRPKSSLHLWYCLTYCHSASIDKINSEFGEHCSEGRSLI